MAGTLRALEPQKYAHDGRRVEVGDLDRLLASLTNNTLDLVATRFNASTGRLELRLTNGGALDIPITVIAGATDGNTRVAVHDGTDTITGTIAGVVKMLINSTSTTFNQSAAANISTFSQGTTSASLRVGNGTENSTLSVVPANIEISHRATWTNNRESVSLNPGEIIVGVYDNLVIREKIILDKVNGVTILSPLLDVEIGATTAGKQVEITAGTTVVTIKDAGIDFAGTAPLKLNNVAGTTTQFLMGNGSAANDWKEPFTFGTSALTAGTVNVTDANVVSTSKVFIQSTSSNGATVRGVLDVHGITTGGFSVTSKDVSTGLILNTDRAAFTYMVVNIV